jgi:cytochrome b561
MQRHKYRFKFFEQYRQNHFFIAPIIALLIQSPCENPLMKTFVRYTRPAVLLHWLLALAIVGTFGFGLYMVELPFSPARIKQYNWHKWAGITILMLSALRLLWRLFNPPPALPTGMASWQIWASKLTHAAMYLLFFSIPIVGWLYSSATGISVSLYGWFQLPDLVARNEALAGILKPTHKYLAYSLAGLVIVHVVAALQHHFIAKDGLLHRMRWSRAP